MILDALEGAGPVFIRRFVQNLGGWEAFDQSTDEQLLQSLRQSGGKHALLTPGTWEDCIRSADRAMAGIQAYAARTLVHGDPDWPAQVDRLRDAPLWLHVRGDASLLSRRSVAIIGTRSPSTWGAA
jgi:DNA processing protein